MDDITVPSKTVTENLTRLVHVFQRLRAAKLKVKPSKCVFLQTSVPFLGHVVTAEGVRTDPEKVKVVQEWPVPRTVKQVRSFVGLLAYYKRFVEGFSEIFKPLFKLCEKNCKFEWTNLCQGAFETSKDNLTSAPVLAYPITGQSYILDTDASQTCVGGVLSQIHEGNEKVIAYMSKTMNTHEVKYCTMRKELLAVVTAVKHWRPYILGHKVLLRTGNAAVSWMKSVKNPTGQVARWLEVIECFELEVQHRPGRLHTNCDALSRVPCKVCARQEAQSELHSCNSSDPTCMVASKNSTKQASSSKADDDQTPATDWEPEMLRQKQLLDPDIMPILSSVESGIKPDWADITALSSKGKTLWRQWERLKIVSGVLYRKFYDRRKYCNITSNRAR